MEVVGKLSPPTSSESGCLTSHQFGHALMTEANVITLCLKNTMQLEDWCWVHQRFTGLAAMKQGGGGERWTEAVGGVCTAGMDGQVRKPRE